jgi:hypothetical protein
MRRMASAIAVKRKWSSIYIFVAFTYLEAIEVRNIVERHLVNIDNEATFPRPRTVRLLTQTLCFIHFELALVALLLQCLSFGKAHGVSVLVRLNLSQFE